jgi:hypothetical protein
VDCLGDLKNHCYVYKLRSKQICESHLDQRQNYGKAYLVIPDDVSAQYASKRVVFSLKIRSRPAALELACDYLFLKLNLKLNYP